jgi:hypothetical protein
MEYIAFDEISWIVEYTDEFGDWWATLSEAAQDDVSAVVELLVELGPNLPFPYCSGVEGSKYAHMRELRVQRRGKPLRVFYAFDPRRAAILLIGGNKAGDKRFYERMTAIADRLYEEHLAALKKEKLIK